jgi:hypothetical protein
MEPLKERIAIKALHRSLRRSIRAAGSCRGRGRSVRPTPFVRLVHLRLNLFAMLEYDNVVGSLKGLWCGLVAVAVAGEQEAFAQA